MVHIKQIYSNKKVDNKRKMKSIVSTVIIPSTLCCKFVNHEHIGELSLSKGNLKIWYKNEYVKWLPMSSLKVDLKSINFDMWFIIFRSTIQMAEKDDEIRSLALEIEGFKNK